MEPRNLGLLVIAIGVGVIVAGALIATGALSWFGRLPGDIRAGGDRVRVFIPIMSMIIVSVVLTLLLNLLLRR
jgi:uncharacterized membrane protein